MVTEDFLQPARHWLTTRIAVTCPLCHAFNCPGLESHCRKHHPYHLVSFYPVITVFYQVITLDLVICSEMRVIWLSCGILTLNYRYRNVPGGYRRSYIRTYNGYVSDAGPRKKTKTPT